MKIAIQIPDSITNARERARYYDSEYRKQWYRLHPEKLKEHKRREYLKNRDKIRKRQKEYQSTRVELYRKRAMEWYEANKDRKREYDRQYRAIPAVAAKKRIRSKEYARKHPEKNRKWSVNNPEKLREIKSRWQRSHPAETQHYCAVRRAKLASVTFDDSAKVFYAFVRSQNEVSCAYCNKRLPGKSAHIDHVVAISKGGAHVSSNLCASCPSCNRKKHSKSAQDFMRKMN